MERMPPWARRGLTKGEIALGRTVFAEEIGWGAVAIVYAPPMPHGAMVPLGDTIIHGLRWRPPWDFAAVGMDEQGWFIHELAHVWQAARGVRLAAAKLSALGRSAYALRYAPDRPFGAYNIEQQAEIARFLFLARSGAPHPQAPAATALAALWPVRAG